MDSIKLKNIMILILFLAATLFITGCYGGKGPEIIIDGTNYKFGEVTEGDEVIFSFTYKNSGTKDLIIKNLYVSCYCVVIKSYDRIIKPGARGQINGRIQTKGFMGDIIKSIRVETNIPQVAPILTIEGKIVKPLVIKPVGPS